MDEGRRMKKEPRLEVQRLWRQLEKAKEALRKHDATWVEGMVPGSGMDITKRNQAEAALRESAERFRLLAESIPVLVWSACPDGISDYYNSRFLEYLGKTTEEMLGWTWASTLHPDDQQRSIDAWTEAFTKGMEYRNEYRIRRADGQYRWHIGHALPLRNEAGNIVRWFGTCTDIDDRKRAEEELRRQAELLDLAHDAIIVRDLDSRIVFWNTGAKETYGWSKAEAQGQKIHELLSTEFPQPHREMEAELFRQGHWQGELSYTRRDGRRIVVTSRWAVQRDNEGNPTAILEINRDITGQKQAEAGQVRLAAILEATSDMVGTADHEGKVLYINRAGRKMLGIGADEDVSQLTVKELQPEWASRFIREHGDAEVIAPEVWSGETTFVSRKGQQIPVSQVVIVHKGAAGEVEFFSTVARDITASKRAEEALKESQRELRLLNSQLLSIQEKERLRVARELHDELGQALTVLKIQLVGIEDKLTLNQHPLKDNCEQMLSYIDTVIENVRRLSWDLSPSSLEDLGLSSALRYLVEETCRIHNLQSSLEIDEIDHLFSPEVQINIYRIFQESLTNVVKHARASQVSAKIFRKNGQVSFMIRDDGRGFNMKQVMSGKSTKRSLGLTAINERVLMTQGSLQIASRRGRGTTIAFAIPTINQAGTVR